MGSSSEPLRRGKSYHACKAMQKPPSRLSLRRKSSSVDPNSIYTAEFFWETFDLLGNEEWTLPKEVDPVRPVTDVLVNRYKDRNVDGSVIFAAVEYCKSIIEHGGKPDTWRHVERKVEDVPLIMRAVLEARADPNAEATHSKGRMKAIHFAAGLGVVPVMEVLLEAMIEAQEDLSPGSPMETAKATALSMKTLNERGQEHYAAIHDSVWFKRYKATEWLLQNNADPNSQNFMGWTPMHIVARQGVNLEFVHLLIKYGADLRCRDKAKDNPLMTAVNKPLFPVSKFHLLASSCHDRKSSFLAYLKDVYVLALENEQASEEFVQVLLGQHRLGELASNDKHEDYDTDAERSVHSNAAEKERPLRFILSVDSATARSGEESEKALAMMAEVMEKAPRAAAMILGVLVGKPMVECPEAHPLPLRANMLIDGCEEKMICDYQPDYFEEEEDDSAQELSWQTRVTLSRTHVVPQRKRAMSMKRKNEVGNVSSLGNEAEDADSGWGSLKKSLLPKVHVVQHLQTEVSSRRRCRLPCWGYDAITNSAPPWHTSLAPMTEKRNDDKEIEVEVLKMPDLLDVRVIRVLAKTEHLSLFAEKTVQGIVNCLWHRLVKKGVRCGICLDVLTLATLLAWIITTEVEDMDRVPLRRSFWLITLSAGVKELCNLCYSVYLTREIKRPPLSYMLEGDVMMDLTATFMLIALAFTTRDDFTVPRIGWGRSILALNVLMRWFQITYMCRPFSKVGKKIVCVLKSFMPMKEMMFITAVVFFGFAVATLLIKDNSQMECKDHCSAAVLMNLFKALLMGDGDGFDALTTLPGGDPSGIFAGALILFATIVFSVSVLNLLIAVYSNEYDRSVMQSDLLFFQERASICFRYLMEPCWPNWRERPHWLWRRWERWYGDKVAKMRPEDKLHKAEWFVSALVGGLFVVLFASALLIGEILGIMWLPCLLMVTAMLLAQVNAMRCDWEHPVRSRASQHFYLWICSQTALGGKDLGDDDRSNQELHSSVRQLCRSLDKHMGDLRGEVKALHDKVNAINVHLGREAPDGAASMPATPRGDGARQPLLTPALRPAPSRSPNPSGLGASGEPRRGPPAMPAAALDGLRRLQHEVSMRQQRRAEELAAASVVSTPRPTAPPTPPDPQPATPAAAPVLPLPGILDSDHAAAAPPPPTASMAAGSLPHNGAASTLAPATPPSAGKPAG